MPINGRRRAMDLESQFGEMSVYGPDDDVTGARWQMYASYDPRRTPVLAHFGPLGYAVQDRQARKAVRVTLTVVQVVTDPADAGPPADDIYWAWLDVLSSAPAFPSPTEQRLRRTYELDAAIDMYAMARAGTGWVLRLRATHGPPLPHHQYAAALAG